MRTIALGLCLLVVSLAGCAGSDSSEPSEPPEPPEPSAPSEHEAPAPETTDRQEAEPPPAVPALTLEYLAAGSTASWCARESGQEDASAYQFYYDGTFRLEEQGELMDGPGVDAFIGSVTVLSREEDRFVVDRAGRELVFSRGDCE